MCVCAPFKNVGEVRKNKTALNFSTSNKQIQEKAE